MSNEILGYLIKGTNKYFTGDYAYQSATESCINLNIPTKDIEPVTYETHMVFHSPVGLSIIPKSEFKQVEEDVFVLEN